MTGEEYQLTNGFSPFYDEDKAVPLLNSLPTTLGLKIKQFIWNKAYDHSISDFQTCGVNKEYRFFIIKSPSIKISYRDYGTHWIVYSITPV